MSISERHKPPVRALHLLRENTARYLLLFRRKARVAAPRRRIAVLHLALTTAVVVAALVLTMFMIDARTIAMVRDLPHWLIARFDQITDFGNAAWLLLPIAVVLA